MNIKLPKTFIPENLVTSYRTWMNPVIHFFNRLNFHPNSFTTIGLILSAVSAYYVGAGHFRIAGLILLFGGICDTIDGSLARVSGKVSRFGALYDSSLDRYAEILFFLGMAFYFVHAEWYKTSVAIFLGLSGSLMVSYVRARAEALNIECKVGILQRPERILLLAAGSLLVPPYTLVFSIWVIAILSNVTAIHRIIHVWKVDQNSDSAV